MEMELIVNLLPMTEERRAVFLNAAEGCEQVFAAHGADVPEDVYARATVILGNPPPRLLTGCKRLRLLQTRSAGVDSYLASGALPEGAALCSAVGAYGLSVSEHLFAMLLASMKRLPAYRDQQRGGRWTDLGPAKTLAGATVLCVGTGDLGSSFSRLCKALGARTLGVRRDSSKPAEGIDEMYGMDELDALLPAADVVALLLPGGPATAHLMDRRRLYLMKPDAILLNGGRGTAVDCAALAEALEEGHLWGACLDVTDPEPLPPEHPLWRQSRAVLTPHAAGGDHLSVTAERIAEIALDNLGRYFAHQPLRNRMI